MIGAVVASLQEHRHVTAGELPGTELPSAVSLPFQNDGGTGNAKGEPDGRGDRPPRLLPLRQAPGFPSPPSP
jgi:hypothetical protein